MLGLEERDTAVYKCEDEIALWVYEPVVYDHLRDKATAEALLW